MTVNDRNLTGTTPAEPGQVQETRKPNRSQGVREGTAATGKPGDRVEFSNALAALSRAMSAIGSERANRVQALTGQYQRGSYHPDSAATARSMVSEALLAEGQ
jgi:anti-sigma28 factor (negative regulator of flagellin synthesis)